MTLLALDIGGANLKAADGRGFARTANFRLWQHRDQLAEALTEVLDGAPTCDCLAVTMTGELADCYATRAEGVRHIVESVVAAADDRVIDIYLTDGTWTTPRALLAGDPLRAAASNWHALAAFAARYFEGEAGLLIDGGSTTFDLIPIVGGVPAAQGATDLDRLAAGELVYTGVERSPICAVIDALPYHGRQIPTAHELFATSGDVYILTEELPEDPRDFDTADGRPQTREFARQRLGRAICTELTMAEAVEAAAAVRVAQVKLLGKALQGVIAAMPSPPSRIVLSGHGEFLSRCVVAEVFGKVPLISLGRRLGPDVSRCAPAHALAVLARERATA